MAGYSELFAAFDGTSAAFFLWQFVEQLMRVFCLTMLPQLSQCTMCAFITLVSFLLHAYKMPFRERTLNYITLYGKATELVSFLQFTFVILGAADQAALATALETAAPIVLQLNMASIYVVTLLSVIDSLVKVKNIIVEKLCKKNVKDAEDDDRDKCPPSVLRNASPLTLADERWKSFAWV